MININKKEMRTVINKKRLFQKHIFGDVMKSDDRKTLNTYFEECVLDKTRLRFYSQPSVLFEIVKLLNNRETNFQNILKRTSPIRWLNVKNINYLIYNFFSYSFLENTLTIHRSLAKYSCLPHFPDGGRRGDYIREHWTSKRKYIEQGISRDLGFDIDADNYNEGRKYARRLFALLNKFDVRFSVWFSGKKGWHFVLADSPQLKENGIFSLKRTTQLNDALCDDLMEHLDISIDKVPASIPISYLKAPYGLDPRENIVILPLTKNQFTEFDKSMLKIDNILKNINIRNRGLIINNNGNIDDVKKLIGAI